MEVVMPRSPSRDFFFPSNSLYASAPASPKPFGNPSEHYYFLSAPASPRGSSFNWEEEKPEADALDFAFEFSGEAEGEAPAPADELFEGGKIRPLNCSLPQSSSTKRRDESESQRGRRGDAIQMIGNSCSEIISGGGGERGRGRGRAPLSASSEGYSRGRGRRAARSLSPLRGGGGGGEFDKSRNSAAASSSASLMRGCGSRSKKWSLKDLFLFRSASDGRAIGRGSKDPLRKYTLLPSFSSSSSPSPSSFTSPSKVTRNNETTAGAATSKSGKGSMASVHETHYSASRAASEEMMKKKTPLPFHRNSLFGYLRFNPAINSIGRRLNSYSLYRGRSSS